MPSRPAGQAGAGAIPSAQEGFPAHAGAALLAPAIALCYKAAVNKILPRLLLTCLLLVALPLKGLAASSMLACGPTHHPDTAAGAHGNSAAATSVHAHELGRAAASAHAHGMAPTAAHDHGDGAAHEHAAGREVDAGAAPSGPESGGALAMDQAPDLKDKSKCGTCAPCCVSAALTDDQSLHIAAPANSADFPAFAAGHSSPPAGRLDRPPRSLLA